MGKPLNADEFSLPMNEVSIAQLVEPSLPLPEISPVLPDKTIKDAPLTYL